MSQALNIYLSIQTLLSLTFILVWALKKYSTGYDFSFLLKFSYFLISLSLILPFIYYFIPGENPFGPIVKVWGEGAVLGENIQKPSKINIRIPSSTISPQVSLGSSVYWGLSAVIPLVVYFLFSLVRLIKSYLQVNRILTDSFLFKKVGKTNIWLNDNTTAPFSFFNGQAHVVLPTDLIDHPSKLQIALAHEVQHHRQRDTLWIYFLEFIKLLFALNPFVKRMVEQTEELQELACDSALVGHKRISPAQYGKCLYEFAENQMLKSTKPIGAVGMAVEAKQLKRRIEIMFKQQRKTSRKAVMGASIIGALMIACTAWATKGVVGTQKISMDQAQGLANKISRDQEVPIVVDAAVLYWLNQAVKTEESRKFLRESLKRMENYGPMIVQKLGKGSLPLELLAVPLVESGFRNDVKSTSLAAGIWQFIPQTARGCGLEVSENQDERLNPSRLTDAAVCYYQKLHAIFQNWHVAISAYNIGERAMMDAIVEAGHNDVLKLAREGALGNEGKTYLPKVIAAMIIVQNPELIE